jgi:predicted MPP superfamily phosphohydrolase
LIPSRYYLTILSLIPILAAQVWIMFRTYRMVQGRPDRVRMWRVYVALASVALFLGVLSEFGGTEGLPRIPMILIQTSMNLWGMASIGGVAIYLVLSSAAKRLPPSFQQERREAIKVIIGAAAASPIVPVAFGTFIERTNFEVCEREIRIPNLPDQLQGLRALQLSDIHLGQYLSIKTLRKIIDRSNELKAQIVFITGDLISVAKDPLDECLRELARLKSDRGIFGCLGNHERYARAEEYTTVQGARLGMQFLRSESRILEIGDARLNIAGVDYQPFEKRPNYLQSEPSLTVPGAVNLLLSHNPDVFPAAAAKGFDLMLSGHTHGGQVTLEILSPVLNPARILTPYVRGLYQIENASCYVNRGIGTLGVPTRLGSTPEITVLRLARA